ncbi:MAG: hypothetical protein ACE366_13520 [Bradymonadia bacterium]
MRNLRWTIPALALSTGLGLSACGDKGGKTDGKTGGDKGQTAQGQKAGGEKKGGGAMATEQAVFAVANDIVKAIPKDAKLAFVTTDFTQIASALGRDGLIKAFPVEYGQMRKEMSEIYGDRDILDPAAWAEMGLDASKPMAVAMLDTKYESIAAYLPLTDGAKFDGFVGPILDKAGAPAAKPGSAVRAMKDNNKETWQRAYLIRKGNLAITLYTRASDAEATAMAEKIATLTPEASLSSNGDASGAFAALKYGKHASLWIDLMGMINQPYDIESQFGVKHAREELAKAEADKDETRIASAKRQLEQELEFTKMRADFHAKEMKILGTAFKGLKGLVLGATTEGPMVGFKGSVEFDKGAPLKGIFKKGDGVPMLVQALDTKPIFMGVGNIDIKGLEAYIDTIIAATGQPMTLAQGKAMVEPMIGFKIDDVLALIHGEAGFAVTYDVSKMSTDDPQKAFGGAGTLRLTDGKKFLETVNTLLANPALKGAPIKSVGEGMWEIPVPEFKPVYVGIVGNYLAASPDKGFLERLKAGDGSKSFTNQLSHPGLKSTLNTADASQIWLNDTTLMGYLMLSVGYWDRPAPYNSNPSPEFTAKLKEYEAAQAAAKAQREKDQMASTKEMSVLMGFIGTQAGTVSLTDRGIELAGGQYLGAKDLADTILKVIQKAMAMEKMEREQRNARRPLEEKVDNLYNELSNMNGNNMPQPSKGF